MKIGDMFTFDGVYVIFYFEEISPGFASRLCLVYHNVRGLEYQYIADSKVMIL